MFEMAYRTYQKKVNPDRVRGGLTIHMMYHTDKYIYFTKLIIIYLALDVFSEDFLELQCITLLHIIML